MDRLYTEKSIYSPKYLIGDRVRGVHNGVPFIGSIAIDSMHDEDVGAHVMVFLDLPIKVEGKALTIVKVKHSDILEEGQSFASLMEPSKKKRKNK